MPSGAMRRNAFGGGSGLSVGGGAGSAPRTLAGTWKAMTSPAPETSEVRRKLRRVMALPASCFMEGLAPSERPVS